MSASDIHQRISGTTGLLSEADYAINDRDARLFNEDLAPVPASKRTWGALEIFNVWTNDVQSLAGYTLAASLFITAGISGWLVFLAIIVASVVVMFLVNLSGKPSVRYGIPYAVIARTNMGVLGARFPALLRGIVGMFWFGAQTYFASTAVALAINVLFPHHSAVTFLSLTWVGWLSIIIVTVFQLVIFSRGIGWISRFLNFAGPAVYVVMIMLLIFLWVEAGDELISGVGSLFQSELSGWAAVSSFVGVVGTMVAYFAAVVVNYGDFSRFTGSLSQMRRGNFYGLPVSLTLFTFLALFITAGSYIALQHGGGEPLTNPADIVGLVGNTYLTLIAAVTFFVATVGINLVANFVPPAYDLANLWPSRISFRIGGYITATVGLIISVLWVAVIAPMGFDKFVDTLGAVLAPLYGLLVCDYYILRKGRLYVADMFTMSEKSVYHFTNGWNYRALFAVGAAAVFSMATVWVPIVGETLGGFGWIIGAFLGGFFHWLAMRGRVVIDPPAADAAAV
ncbi:NCS1 family nucleobase:cation symporter-1 [Castellaniella sp.]|uniref:NCS1 family nucleobase:cation symporter-1 n=1 Tax=Castellaniella sp. TaxID=1955812 RepID=UPI002AFE9569|nr:NCS1 family nucleobase:cation symporter-1 [Castellaniella sp.]